MSFKYNSYGVCMNPETVFRAMKKGALAWDYAEIKVSESGGNWFWGHWMGGGCGPCSVVGEKFPTRDDAIDDAYKFMLPRLLKDSLEKNGAFTKNAYFHLQELKGWASARKQYSLF